MAGEQVQQAASEATESAASVRKKTPKQETDSSSAKRRRRFPYRKVAEIEADIFEREARIEEIHQALASAKQKVEHYMDDDPQKNNNEQKEGGE